MGGGRSIKKKKTRKRAGSPRGAGGRPPAPWTRSLVCSSPKLHSWLARGSSARVRLFFFSSRRRQTRFLNVTGVQRCALPIDRKSTRLNSSHIQKSRMPSSACDWSSDVCCSVRSEEHTSELQSHSEISYAVFCLRSEERRVGKE